MLVYLIYLCGKDLKATESFIIGTWPEITWE